MSRFLIGACVLMAVRPCGAQTTERWQFGVTPTFSTGTYGTDSSTSVLQTPFVARRLFRDGDVTAVFPFTCVSGESAITIVNGSPVRTERLASSARTSGRTERQAAPPVPATRARSAATDCGMGDIVVRGRYYVVDERGPVPTIALRAHLKAPTARAELGLGTGRPDEGVGVEISKTTGNAFLVMVDGGYTVIGKPKGTAYENNWWYDVGVGRDLARGAVNVSVFYEEDSAVVPGFSKGRDVLASLMLKGRGWRFQVGTLVGLSEGAPAVGLALGASRRF